MQELSNGNPGFFYSLVQSCVSPGFYVQVAEQSFNRSLFYLVRVLALASVLLAIQFSIEFVSISGRIVSEMESQGFPTILLKDGVAESDPKGRYEYEDTETGIRIVIDTQLTDDGAVEVFKASRPHVLLSNRKLIARADETGWREYDLRRLNSFIFDIGTCRLVRRILIVSSFVLLPIAILISNMATKTLYVLILGTAGWLAAGLRGRRLALNRVFHAAIYALTLPVLVDTFLTLFGLGVPYLFTILYLVYLLRGLTYFPPNEAASTVPKSE